MGYTKKEKGGYGITRYIMACTILVSSLFLCMAVFGRILQRKPMAGNCFGLKYANCNKYSYNKYKKRSWYSFACKE